MKILTDTATGWEDDGVAVLLVVVLGTSAALVVIGAIALIRQALA